MTDGPDTTATPPASIAAAAWLNQPATRRVFAALTATGHSARAVGGCVRNSLLACIDPGIALARITDIDIATTARPDEVISMAGAAGLETVPTGIQHGTITVIADGCPFEVTTLRRDIATDGRHAAVAFTDDWHQDAARRDFTINALYADQDGTVFDPLGGYPDLVARRIRFVGDPATRIREDYLRILRFFRLFAQYGIDVIDSAGIAACVAERSGLARLSAERIRQELMKLLAAPAAVRAVTLMARHGLLTEVLPAAPSLGRLARLIAIDPDHDAALRLAALVVHKREDAARFSEVLRLSRSETDVLECAGAVIENQVNTPIDLSHPGRQLYRLGPDAFIQVVKLEAAITANTSKVGGHIRLARTWHPPQLPVNGGDLIDLGMASGPQLGDLLRDLEADWIASDFALTRERLLEIARSSIAAA